MGKLRASAIAAAVLAVATTVVSACGGSEPSSPPARTGTAAAPPSTGVEKAIWGPLQLPDGSSAFPVYERLGVDVLQMQLRWADVAAARPADPGDPADPAYAWPAELERAIREASKRDIRIALLVTATPGWANGGRAEIRAPDDDADFADFLTAAARRFPQVRDWMIWGEPNRIDRFQPNRIDDPVGPRRYAGLLDTAYAALKDVSESNVVIGGMAYTGGEVKPPDFIRWMKLPSGLPPRLDLFGADPYPFRLPDLAEPPAPGGWRDLSDIDTLADEVEEAYGALGISPRLWLSEFTIQSGEDSRFFEYHVSEDEQALWLRRGYEAAAQAGDVVSLGWFALLDRPAGSGHANWGLLREDGSRKPAFRAYASIPGR